MSYSFALTQKVNFYVSILFVLAFGFFMTTMVTSTINRVGSNIQYLSAASELAQVGQ